MRGPSPRVRLEVALLDAERADPSVASTLDVRADGGVLVVAAEADLRRYVRECLRDMCSLRIIEAGSVHSAQAIAAQYRPHILLVDEPERDVLALLPGLAAILLVDEMPREAVGDDARVRLLARPFTAEALITALRGLGATG